MSILEKWEVISDFPKYEVSNLGEVRNRSNKRVLTKVFNKQTGYLQVTLRNEDHFDNAVCCVHRLVAKAFINNPNDFKCINHKDENKQNNRVTNLEWSSYKMNSNYGTRNKRISASLAGKPHPHVRRRPVVAINENGKRYKFRSVKDCAETLEIYPSTIHLILRGKMQQSKGYKIMEDK